MHVFNDWLTWLEKKSQEFLVWAKKFCVNGILYEFFFGNLTAKKKY